MEVDDATNEKNIVNQDLYRNQIYNIWGGISLKRHRYTNGDTTLIFITNKQKSRIHTEEIEIDTKMRSQLSRDRVDRRLINDRTKEVLTYILAIK